MILVSIYDKKAAVYQQPFAFDNLYAALRTYSNAIIKNPDANIVRFAEDFDLYDVGFFDESNGLITAITPPNFIESMTNLKFGIEKGSNNA